MRVLRFTTSRLPKRQSAAASAGRARRCSCSTAIRRPTSCGTGSRRAWRRTSRSSRPTSAAMAKAPSRETTADHEPYSKRAMARDQVAVMRHFGFERFSVVGHDRGGRVAYRMALDHPEKIEKLAVLDILPTLEHYRRTDMAFATAYWHWFFLIQPFPMPETMIGGDPEWFFRRNWPGAQRAAEVLRSRSGRRLLARLQRSEDHPRHLRGLPRRRDLRSEARRGGFRQAEDRMPAAGALGREGRGGATLRSARGLARTGRSTSAARRSMRGTISPRSGRRRR